METLRRGLRIELCGIQNQKLYKIVVEQQTMSALSNLSTTFYINIFFKQLISKIIEYSNQLTTSWQNLK